MKTILCVRLKNFPIDRLLRELRRTARSREISRSAGSSSDLGIRSSSDRLHPQEQRKRRWKHQLWYEGPLDQKFPPRPASANQPDTDAERDAAILNRANLNRANFARPKLFMPDRGICMTPSIRANGPSYMKPVPPPVVRSRNPVPSIDPPLAITRAIATRQLVVALSDSASTHSARVGMTLTEARALCPGLKNFDEDPQADAKAIEALARWMMRFTPTVSIGAYSDESPGLLHSAAPHCATPRGVAQCSRQRTRSSPGDSSSAQAAPDSIFLDITGCARVFGGISTIVEQVISSLRRFRLSAKVAVAPNPAAAWAVASFSDNGKIVTADDLPSVLASLPIAALHLEDDLLAALHHLGLETIAQLQHLPRNALPSRFGHALLHHLDQALGHIDQPLVPLVYHAPLEARMDFEGVIDSLETIYLVFKQLIAQLVTELTHRGCGARTIDIEFFRAYAQTIRHTIALSRPSRDPGNLFNLIRCAIENLDGGDDGFLGIRLFVPTFERISDDQITLLDHERHAGELEFSQLIERLRIRMRHEAIGNTTSIESHIPEYAWRTSSMAVPAMALKERGRDAHATFLRPLQLLYPDEIGAMVSPSEDRNGRPILFRHENEVHHLTHALGPERISGEWWRGHHRTRDYFDVEDESGKRFWIFRVCETGKWYLHGVFA